MLGAVVLALGSSGPPPSSTISTFFGWDDREVGLRRLRETDARIQQFIHECMDAKGYDYIEHVPEWTDSPASLLSPEQYAATYGFGITDPPPAEVIIDPDPNQMVLDALTPLRQQSFIRALRKQPSFGRYGAGCEGWANQSVYGWQEQLLRPVETAVERLGAGASLDPRAVEGQAQWVSCVRDGGFEIERPDQIESFLMDTIKTRLGATPSTSPEWENLRAHERKLATALARCNAQLDKVRSAIARELEGRFILQNYSQLATIRDALDRGPDRISPP